MASFLADFGNVTGIDVSPRALFYCRKRSLRALSQASVIAIPFAAGSFDLVTSFDVLYERSVDNDGQAFGEFFRVLSPGGCLLLRLPAYDWLRGQHDQVVHTGHRYTLGQVKHLLSVNGFKVRMASYANMLLFIPAMVKRLGEQFLPPGIAHSDLEIKVGRLNNFLCSILSSEARFISSPGLPFGLSVFAMGQKTS
jgi:SAM-dependent methyltransferase